MGRKWKIALGVLAVVVVFCLWYTRPRSFEELALSGEIDNMAATAIVTDFSSGLTDMKSWDINSHEGIRAILLSFGVLCWKTAALSPHNTGDQLFRLQRTTGLL